ncbi:uncharacterized protein N0V89_008065 [Didymosphaeria variabile]|uniref:GST C-terminal domain-containing protein n=1 Tax=Didymosphaeria variabile TaxID=1932322 RepID=A0A9W8XFK3_9PLEO|nr:uncharacterized protein N0V89_008065 [Didymosphaeria variabile]KAJ4349450.1 hypothetical protein N0V89_008065 [Didymosphaeria variabile]
MLWEAATWFSVCYVYLIENVVKPLLKGEPDQKAIDGQSEKFHRGAGIMNDQLDKTKWLTGPNATLADIAVAAPMHLHAASKLPLEKYPSVKRWLGQVEQLESWKKTQVAVDKALLPDGTPMNGSNGASGNGQPEVRATVNYTKAVDGITELYFYETEKAKNIHEPGDAPVEVSMSNGWPHAKDFHIDENGFSVHSLKTSHSDWEDEEAVRSTFYPKVVSFLKATLDAKRVLVFDHAIRTEKNTQKALTDGEKHHSALSRNARSLRLHR